MSAVVALTALAAWHAPAATRSEVMQSKYLRYNFCMQTALGRAWWEQHDVAQGLNRWGVSESTSAGITSAPRAVRNADTSCRASNDLASEPRPTVRSPKRGGD